MTAADVLNSTSTLVLMLWVASQWAATQNSSERIKAAVLATAIPALFLALGQSGLLANFNRFPPPFMLLPVLIIGLSTFLAFSVFGDRIIRLVTLPNLVLFHSFRILAELVIYKAVHEGIAPVQLSIEGYNFDIVTGLSSLVLGIYLRRNSSRKLIFAFNFMGLFFLTVVMAIAITSMPTPLRIFMNEPANTWVTHSPYILLPGVLVTAALTGHLLIFRKLRASD